jgi:hypothetical protein
MAPQRNKKPSHVVRNHHKLRAATAAGQVVSIDQLVSPTAGFIPTHRGTPTTKRYIGATVFADHFSDFTYVHLKIKMAAESTVEAKLAFERLLSSHGVTILHYNSDNGLFDTKAFKNAINKAGQMVLFCGVNVHHQNGKSESRIKDVTTSGRTALLHAAHTAGPKPLTPPFGHQPLNTIRTCENELPTEYTPGQKIGRRKSPGI